MAGVGVVEVDVGGQAEAVAEGSAELEVVRQPVAARQLRGEDSAATGKDLFAGADGERGVLGGVDVEVEIACAAVAAVLAE